RQLRARARGGGLRVSLRAGDAVIGLYAAGPSRRQRPRHRRGAGAHAGAGGAPHRRAGGSRAAAADPACRRWPRGHRPRRARCVPPRGDFRPGGPAGWAAQPLVAGPGYLGRRRAGRRRERPPRRRRFRSWRVARPGPRARRPERERRLRLLGARYPPLATEAAGASYLSEGLAAWFAGLAALGPGADFEAACDALGAIAPEDVRRVRDDAARDPVA